MGRLRRRIRLIYVDYPAGQSHMTVVRRELPPSRGASRLGREIGRRIVSARALQSCPQRAAPDAAQDADRQDLKSSFTQFSRGGLALALGHRGPEEADEFAGDRRHGDGRAFAVPDEIAITPVQALLRTPGLADNLPGLPLTPRGQRVADSGPVAIVPGGLDEGAAHVRVASLGQRSPTLRVAREILTGHQPEIGHELPRTLEPLEVHHLDQEDHGRQGVDPAEARRWFRSDIASLTRRSNLEIYLSVA